MKSFNALPVSDEDRAEYELELNEQAGRYMDAGLSEQEASARAFDDLGCLEFWRYVRQVNAWVDARRRPATIKRKKAA